MTNPITPEAAERLWADQGDWAYGDANAYFEPRDNCVEYIRMSSYDALARELAEVKAERDGYREWGADVKRLTRELDVEMHGEENAAQQASLCDLIGAGKELRERAEKAEAALATARAQIVAAQEDMKERAAQVLGHHRYGYGTVACALGNRLCCDGNMCGCQGVDVGSYLQYLIRALPLTDPAGAKEEIDND